MNTYLPLLVLAGLLALAPASAEAREVMCTMQYQPVCGAQQVQCVTTPCYPVYHTYGNSCTLGAENGTFIHEGECTEKESGPVKPAEETYTPPKTCVAWFDGCNSCSKGSNGQSMCTLKACMGAQAPGHCTKYETTQPVVNPKPPTATTTEPVATTSIAEPESIPTGFFARLWLSIRAWFSWL